MKTQNVPAESILAPGQFPVPFSEPEFRRDILVLFVHQLRTLAWMAGGDYTGKIWAVVGFVPEDPDSSDIYAPDLQIEDLGITFDSIAQTSFAHFLLNMYHYAYFGVLDESFEAMEYETNYTMLSAILCDMNKSLFTHEWESFYRGGEVSLPAERCLAVAETANARRVLEGHERFSDFYGSMVADDSASLEGSLSIRQMALLAGMEEMSIRAAANPKRANPLPTYSEEKRTRVDIEAAKAWLKAKGLYIPITRRWNIGDIDLSRRDLSSFEDLVSVIRHRQLFVASSEEQGATKRPPDLLSKFLSTYGAAGLDKALFSNADFVGQLADILKFPIELFSIRVREALAKDELKAVKDELRAQGIAARSN